MFVQTPCGLLCEFIPNSSDALHVALIVKNGAFSDRDFPGRAHFLEHMLMEINLKDSESIDLSMKGTTLFEHTQFLISANLTFDSFIKALELVRNIIFGEYLSGTALEKVRCDILREYELALQNNSFIIESHLIQEVGINKNMPIGNRESIARMKFADLLDSYNKEYKIEKMKLCILGGHQEWVFQIIQMFSRRGKIGSNSASYFFNNTLYRIEEAYINKYDYEYTIFLKDNYFFTNNIALNDLVTTISLTLLEELIKGELGDIEDNVLADIVQFSAKYKFVRIRVKKYRSLLNPKKMLKKISSKLQKEKHSAIFDEIFHQYGVILERNDYGFQYIQHLVDCFIYDRQAYKNSDLLMFISEENKSNLFEIIMCYLNALLTKNRLYLYKVQEGKVIHEG
ncbi:hypothetical protein KQI45_05365 [Clostridium sporogenes]|uniref:insulinase family protein n=1 Tax=Clostridium sporogenes TaxID=1509 RepID=UPI001C121E67|nr:insulinase family protein [Clostridium sporogenes]MBU5299504.1 hypothetical protein [Clostridium sporogenes]